MMKFSIPMVEKVSTNKIYAGVHWSVRNRIKDNYLQLIKYTVKHKKIIDYPVNIEFKFIFKKNPLDSSNCSFMGKMIEDALVKCELLEDDRIQYVHGVNYISIKDRSIKENLIEVTITPNT